MPLGADLQYFNNNAVFAAIVSGKDAGGNSTGTKYAAYILPIEFKAANINLGFDPPIKEDRHALGDEPDQKHAEWWTSVVSETTTGRTNDNVTFVVSRGASATAQFGVEAIKAKNDSEDRITATSAATVNGKTRITITTLPHNERERHHPTVTVKTKKPDGGLFGTPHMLDVDVLPLRKIQIGIWYLEDTRAGEASSRVPPIPAAFKDTDAIIKKLNEIYSAQAGIQFELAKDGVGVKNRPFDGAGGAPNGALDVATPSLLNAELQEIFPLNMPLGPTVNLVLLRRIWKSDPVTGKGVDDLGETYDSASDRSFVQTYFFEQTTATHNDKEDFLITCAHEIGHQLGLSTHTLKDTGSPRKHDQGLFPSQDYYLDGSEVPSQKRWNTPESDSKKRLLHALMSQGAGAGQWKWIRHEDWERANDNAAKLEQP